MLDTPIPSRLAPPQLAALVAGLATAILLATSLVAVHTADAQVGDGELRTPATGVCTGTATGFRSGSSVSWSLDAACEVVVDGRPGVELASTFHASGSGQSCLLPGDTTDSSGEFGSSQTGVVELSNLQWAGPNLLTFEHDAASSTSDQGAWVRCS